MKLPLWLHLFWQKVLNGIGMASNPLYRGVDVSEFNGEVDFGALRNKIDFAILRCGYGSDYPYQDDECFTRNVQACQKADIPYGVYLYAYAKDEDMAKSEAAHVLRLIKGTDPAFGVWYDVEDASLPYGNGLTTVCQTWCDTLLHAGITCVGLYASLSVMENYLSCQELEKYEKWVAQWNSTCDYENPGIWQFTDKEELNGKIFDMDYAYKDYPDITGATMTQDKFDEMLGVSLKALHQEPVDSWAKKDWDEACKQGLFDGSGPRSPLTREQAAMVFERLIKMALKWLAEKDSNSHR